MAGDAVRGRRARPSAAPRPAQRGIKRSRCICVHCHDGKRLFRVLEHPCCPDHGRGGEWRCVGTMDDPGPGDGNTPSRERARRRGDP
jgi:hypothetical protein